VADVGEERTRTPGGWAATIAFATRALTLSGLLALATPATTRAQVTPPPGSRPPATSDTLAALVTDYGFNSIVDGQPNAPGQWDLLVFASWRRFPTMGNPVSLLAIPEYTPRGSRFVRNALYGVFIPVQVSGIGRGFGSLGPFWQQRWLADERRLLSLATFVQVGLPTAKGSSGLSFLLVGTGGKALGPGVLYLVVLGQTTTTGSPTGWGGLAGYKWIVTPRFYLVGDYNFASFHGQSAQSTLEFSPEFIINSRLAIGPGVFIGLSNPDVNPRYGFGVLITYAF
jgi:hypothetical protein